MVSSTPPSHVQGYRWKRSYRFQALLIKTIAVVAAVLLVSVGRFGLSDENQSAVGFTWGSVAIYSVAFLVIWLTTPVMEGICDDARF
jgi:hypothetical protein